VAYLRRDEVLPGDAVVIRGGILAETPEDIRVQAEGEYLRLEREDDPEPVYGLSVWSLPAVSAEAVAEAVGTDDLPHKRMRATTVRDLEACGYEVVPSGPPSHATIVFPGPPTYDDWQNLQQSFGDPMDNPVARARRNRPS
jgi:hypothetical protein